MPDFIVTKSTRKIATLRKRFRLLAGGMRASKTISILMCLIDMSQTDKTPKLSSVVSESFPHLRRGAIRDFVAIMKNRNYWKDELWSETNSIYTFETGSQIEFFSADSSDKVRGPGRDRLFVNEANNLKRETWEQLVFRTREVIYGDWNPLSDSYLYEEYGLIDEPKDGSEPYSTDERVDFLVLTYKDNEALEDAIVQDIELKAENNAEFRRVFAQGLRGSMESNIFENWKIIDDIPHEARLEVGGGDFGFARDKTAFCDIYRYNGGYIIDEIVSRVGFKDSDLATMLTNRPNPNLLYIVDSADKQKVLLMQDMGVNAVGVVKQGSNGDHFTNAAIGFVQDQQVSITKRSVNYIKSYRNFKWQVDKDGEVRSNPPKYDHYMSDEMMSVVYGMTIFTPREEDTTEWSSGDLSALMA